MSLVRTRLPGSRSNLQRRPAADRDKVPSTAGLSRQIAAEAEAQLGRDGAPHSRLAHRKYPRQLGGSEGPVVCRFSDAGSERAVDTLGRPASEKRQGTKSRE